jgi:hypothetical protein
MPKRSGRTVIFDLFSIVRIIHRAKAKPVIRQGASIDQATRRKKIILAVPRIWRNQKHYGTNDN